MNTINMNFKYTAYHSAVADLPEGYTGKDIKDIFVKWNEGTIILNDNTEIHFLLDDNVDGDFKYPEAIEAFENDYDTVVYTE